MGSRNGVHIGRPYRGNPSNGDAKSCSPLGLPAQKASTILGQLRVEVKNWQVYAGKRMAPQVGLEPTTLRLTAGCSAIELLRSVS